VLLVAQAVPLGMHDLSNQQRGTSNRLKKRRCVAVLLVAQAVPLGMHDLSNQQRGTSNRLMKRCSVACCSFLVARC
jgi:hypothetical protein